MYIFLKVYLNKFKVSVERLFVICLSISGIESKSNNAFLLAVFHCAHSCDVESADYYTDGCVYVQWSQL